MANRQLPDFLTAENELNGQEVAYIAQNGKTRKSTLQKIKEFIIGTVVMGTTATNVTGAVKEINDKVGGIDVENNGDIATQLNDLTKNKDDIFKYGEYGLNEALSFASGTSTNGIVLNKVIKESDLFILQANGFIQIVEDGLYFIEGTVNWQSNNTGIRDMRLYGGGKFLVGNSINAHDTLTTKISCSSIVYLSKGNTVYMTQVQNSGGALSVDNNFTHFKIVKIG